MSIADISAIVKGDFKDIDLRTLADSHPEVAFIIYMKQKYIWNSSEIYEGHLDRQGQLYNFFKWLYNQIFEEDSKNKPDFKSLLEAPNEHITKFSDKIIFLTSLYNNGTVVNKPIIKVFLNNMFAYYITLPEANLQSSTTSPRRQRKNSGSNSKAQSSTTTTTTKATTRIEDEETSCPNPASSQDSLGKADPDRVPLLKSNSSRDNEKVDEKGSNIPIYLFIAALALINGGLVAGLSYLGQSSDEEEKYRT